ncbi:YjjG family noncanonical pyrimidine nucleotidase [Brevibacillus fluminis]|uniref:YjjG family noncanonical pyrimidine nucleotidase n=1 Tax=Brevibacillus fluminis TaxID=511487 RepID=UPI003F8C0071
MKYEIILFDVDDTLFDFRLSEKTALQQAFVEFNLPTGLTDYETSYKEISAGLWRSLEQGSITLAELGVERFNQLFLTNGLALDAAEFNRVYLGYLSKGTYLMPGALDLCRKLTGHRLAIITNGFAEVQKARIAGSLLSEAFEHIITSEEAGCQKPGAGIFEYVFSKLQITEKRNALIVGDSLTSDIQGGNNFGIDTCWFNPHRKNNGTEIKPTYEIHAFEQLMGIVAG